MINAIFKIAQYDANKWSPLVRNAKIMEEVGEFSEALLFKLGHLPHKKMKEPIEGEAADVILCILDTLASVYPEMTHDELSEMLEKQLIKKSQKWIDVMHKRSQ